MIDQPQRLFGVQVVGGGEFGARSTAMDATQVASGGQFPKDQTWFVFEFHILFPNGHALNVSAPVCPVGEKDLPSNKSGRHEPPGSKLRDSSYLGGAFLSSLASGALQVFNEWSFLA